MAQSKEQFSPNIKRLNSSNYAIWAFKISMLLTKEDLYHTIEDDPPTPVTAAWAKADRHARALINLFLDDSQIIHIKHETNARDTWIKLKNIHERSGLTNKLYLLRKLYSKRLENGGNMEAHIVSLLELVDKLRAIGEEIKETHISALMLCSLPTSYDNLITALEARNEDELTPEFIKSKLIDEYRRRLESSDTFKLNTLAYKTGKPRNHDVNKDHKYCSYCKKNSHNKSDCWFLKNKTHNNHQQQRKYENNNKSKHKSSVCFENAGCYPEENSRDNNDFCDNTDTMDPDYVLKVNSGRDQNKNNTKFYVDSGATCHMSSDINFFNEIDTQQQTMVTIANGKVLKAEGTGSGFLMVENTDGSVNKIKFENVLYVPDLEGNLISVRAITKKGNCIIFKENKCFIKHGEKIIAEAVATENLYELTLHKSNDIRNTENANSAIDCNNQNCIELWHRRLGHRDYNIIKKMANENLAEGIKLSDCRHSTTCSTCIKGKLTEKPYPKQSKFRAKQPLELVHSDLCGPISTPSIGGSKYFITFVDDFSRFTMIYLVSRKDEFIEKLKEYEATTMNKFGRRIQTLRTDNGGEYVNREVELHLSQRGILHQLSVPYSPQQNGIAERKNRSLVEMTRCLLSDADLPHRFWGEAVQTANYLQNRLPTKANNYTSPIELWTGTKPNLNHIKTFGCKIFALVHKQNRRKLDDKAIEGIFVGYDNRSKGYRVYLGNNNIIISRSVKFIENNMSKNRNDETPLYIFRDRETEDEEKSENNSEEAETKIETPEVVQPRRSERSNKGIPPEKFAYSANVVTAHEPKSWREVMEMPNPEKQKWIKATETEMNSLMEHGTWDIVDLPAGKRVIGSKWTFKLKYNSSGMIERYKARLVAKGFNQKFGEDYDETFAPVVKHTTIRTFLTAASYKQLHVHHVDITTAFLHGDLEEDVYMSQPEGYIKAGEENKVCKLKKSIYGLKQAARAWHMKIGETLIKLGFKQSKADSCLFTTERNGKAIYIILYVDDLLISGSKEDITNIIKQLEKEFEIKNLGKVTYYLGIHIERTQNGNFLLNQKNKIKEVIEKFKLSEAKPTNTPMSPEYLKLEGEHDKLPDNKQYRSAVGALLYIATVSRPDISLAVNMLSRKNEKPTQRDWDAVKKVIRYLKTTIDMKLIIDNNKPPILTAYADADWANDKEDRKSTSGNIFKIGTTPILWTSKKQNCVSLSSTEAEYVSAATAAQEIQWLINIAEDLDMKQTNPITLYEDNQSCIKISQSEKYNSRTKHIDIKYHYLRDLSETNVIVLEYLPSNKMDADILTKPLPRPNFERIRDSIGITDCKDSQTQ